jgi:hypothetical protein
MYDPLVVCESNISIAWARLFLAVMTPGIEEVGPVLVCLTVPDNGDVRTDTSIRAMVDNLLRETDNQSIDTVAATIFPISLWNPARERALLYERYARIFRKIKKCRQNVRGTYFQRLTSFSPNWTASDFDPVTPTNQIENIITFYKSGNHRRSALQATIFDPTRDQKNQRQTPFPCLQQIALAPLGERELSMNAFYATQFVVERAYGNYLGLVNLGRFFAHELGLQFRQLNCFVGVAKKGRINKSDLFSTEKHIRTLLEMKE